MLRSLLPASCLMLLLSVVVAAADEPMPALTGFEVMVDAGAVMPLGDLGAGLPNTATGMGAELGYRLGLRLRWTGDHGLFLAPVFSYSEFGDHDGVDDQSGKTDGVGQKYTVRASTLRYGMEAGYLSPGATRDWRLHTALGIAAVEQRYREELVAEEAIYEATLYDVAWLASVGVRRGNLEVALEYHGCNFTTARFLRTGPPASYNWSHAALRVSFGLPR